MAVPVGETLEQTRARIAANGAPKGVDWAPLPTDLAVPVGADGSPVCSVPDPQTETESGVEVDKIGVVTLPAGSSEEEIAVFHRDVPMKAFTASGNHFPAWFILNDLIQNGLRYSEQTPNQPRVAPNRYRTGPTTESLSAAWNFEEGFEPNVSVENGRSYLFDPSINLAATPEQNMDRASFSAAECGSGNGFAGLIGMSEAVEIEWRFAEGETINVRVVAILDDSGVPKGGDLIGTHRRSDGTTVELDKPAFAALVSARPY